MHAFISQYRFVIQGDDCDSSDEEWDQHIGTHARAFLGLHEPVVEIALDEGVGIGTMVRNAFARADDIHTRASLAESTSTGDQEASSANQQAFRGLQSDDADSMNAEESDADIPAPQPYHMFDSSADMGSNFNSDSSHGLNPSVSGDNESQGASGDGVGNEDIDENPSDSYVGSDWSSSDDMSTDNEDVEELLGQIPNDRMGSNPEIDIAATLPLYEGSTLSMLCATLLIVNCCKTHGLEFVHE